MFAPYPSTVPMRVSVAMSGSGTPARIRKRACSTFGERTLPPFRSARRSTRSRSARSSARPRPRSPGRGISSGARRRCRPRRSRRGSGRHRRRAVRSTGTSARSSFSVNCTCAVPMAGTSPSPNAVDLQSIHSSVYRSRASCFPAPSDGPPSSTVRHVRSHRPASPTPPWRTSRPRAASPSSSCTGTSGRRRSSTARSSSRSSIGSARSSAAELALPIEQRAGRPHAPHVAREDPAAFTLLWRHAAREPQFAAYAAELRSVSVAVVRDLTSLDTGDELLDAWRSDVLFDWLVEATLTWLQRGNPHATTISCSRLRPASGRCERP